MIKMKRGPVMVSSLMVVNTKENLGRVIIIKSTQVSMRNNWVRIITTFSEPGLIVILCVVSPNLVMAGISQYN